MLLGQRCTRFLHACSALCKCANWLCRTCTPHHTVAGKSSVCLPLQLPKRPSPHQLHTGPLRAPYTINHVAKNGFAQHKFAHSRSSQSAPYTFNHVAQHAMLRNMIDRVWAPLQQHTSPHTVRCAPLC
jgi:hypothetical protein